jgi:hypothetical protein
MMLQVTKPFTESSKYRVGAFMLLLLNLDFPEATADFPEY